MSKYIAIIDLPDDGKCHGCKVYRPLGYYTGKGECSELGMCIRRVDSAQDDTVSEIINAVRPTDCPLIPVDRVIGSVFHLDASVQYGVSTDDVASMLRDELGVTE